jgi:hypothetical protein
MDYSESTTDLQRYRLFLIINAAAPIIAKATATAIT